MAIDGAPAERANGSENGKNDQLFVVDDGPRGAEPVLLVHGLSLDHRMWRPQVEPLVGSGRRVIRYDVRGFGRSPAVTAQHRFDADDMPRLLDRLGVDRAHVVGLSLGGAITADIGIHHGDRVRSLVFADAAVGGLDFDGAYGDINSRIVNVARADGVAAAKREWLACDLFAAARRNVAVARALAEMVEDYAGKHWLRDDRYIHGDSWDRLDAITAPSLVLVGALDLDDFQRAAGGLASRIPGATQVVLEDAGHMSNMEQPEAFNAALLAFLDACP